MKILDLDGKKQCVSIVRQRLFNLIRLESGDENKGFNKLNNLDTNTFHIVDLFSGCGGFSLGAISAVEACGKKARVKLALDFSAHAAEAYKTNFSEYLDNFILGDMTEYVSPDLNTKLSKKELLLKKRLGHIDFLIAGPPCQGHSDLNNKTRRNDPRNKLYLSAIRAVKVLKPIFVAIENVSSVVHSSESVVQVGEKYLQDNGYETLQVKMDCQFHGLAQTRKRHFLLAEQKAKREDTKIRIDLEKCLPIPLKKVIGDLQKEYLRKDGIYYQPSKMTQANIKRAKYLYNNDLYDLPNKMRPICHQNTGHSYKSMYGRLHWEKPAQTITSGFGSMGQGRWLHPSEKRVLTPHEAARIQGFPDSYSFEMVTSRTQLHILIANAVPPAIGELITKSLVKLR